MSARRLREAIKTSPRDIPDNPHKAVENEHEYLRQCVDPVLMPLIESLLLYQPESVYHFIHDFVDEQKSSRFVHHTRSVGYAKKLTNRRKMADFMSTSVIPVMDDLAKQILREKPNSVKAFIRDVVAARIIIESNEDPESSNQVERAVHFNVNDRVLSRYKGRPRFFPGIITAVDDHGNFTVLYDDGKTESNVHCMCLKLHSGDKTSARKSNEESKDNQERPKATRIMEIVLLIIGIDGAGKTTLLSTLQGDLDKEHVPSAGFTSATFQTDTGSATFYDLGGGPAFRNVWKEYYADAAIVLEESMANELMVNKPLLIFANKRDHSDAVTEQEMQKLLRLSKFPSSKIVPCVAKPAVFGGVDERLESGLQWLFDQVHNDFDSLHERVQRDLAMKKSLISSDGKSSVLGSHVGKKSENSAKCQRRNVDNFREILDLSAPNARMGGLNGWHLERMAVGEFEPGPGANANDLAEIKRESQMIKQMVMKMLANGRDFKTKRDELEAAMAKQREALTVELTEAKEFLGQATC
ncbi:hypothetical protein AM588_10004682 [Phytophthora nicotianae]|uniref:Uncharacterized protein n=1 Tax=Phytophthora nicotianae TaxID=4792 RepID=A0A0W8DE81_PHYNI|nr:hypothetical protein AM588_10004682 [Phytophthora nicotianae]